MTADLKVIGAGFGRTGTSSMRDALGILGFGPCHHMKSLIDDPAHSAAWSRAIFTNQMDWDVLLGGFAASIDWPSAYYWPRLMRAFPNAKVLLTLRDSESWWRSFERTILPIIMDAPGDGTTTAGKLLLGPLVFREQPMTKAHCIAIYEENIARVRAEVPAERLHVHEVGDGWGRLCAFLDVPVPDQPFPHKNTAADFNAG